MKSKNQTRLPLLLLPKEAYVTHPETDPLVYYYLPIIGPFYRRRVEMCLAHCLGGERVLEVGYGSGVAFPPLANKYLQIYGIDLFADRLSVAEMWNRHGIKPFLQNGNLLNLPYKNEFFDTVLLISILEHIKPGEQIPAMKEIHRVLKRGGQVVYGVPVERPLLVFVYRLMGYNIRHHHFSTQQDVRDAARSIFSERVIEKMKGPFGLFGDIYEIGHFVKTDL